MFDAVDWQEVEAALDRDGVAVLPGLLDAQACRALAALYAGAPEGTFRSRVVMARHGFGRGEYQYFDYPLPPPLPVLRAALYAQLAPIERELECSERPRCAGRASNEKIRAGRMSREDR